MSPQFGREKSVSVIRRDNELGLGVAKSRPPPPPILKLLYGQGKNETHCTSIDYGGIMGVSNICKCPDRDVRLIPVDSTTHCAMTSRISAPLVFLNALVAIGIAFAIYTTYRGVDVSERSNYLWTACFSYCVAWWIERDRKVKGFSAPFEYQAFVFFLWPFIAPYYFFKTRGWRGLALGLGLFLYACVPGAAQLATYLLISETL